MGDVDRARQSMEGAGWTVEVEQREAGWRVNATRYGITLGQFADRLEPAMNRLAQRTREKRDWQIECPHCQKTTWDANFCGWCGKVL